jgi:hypothetical protein
MWILYGNLDSCLRIKVVGLFVCADSDIAARKQLMQIQKILISLNIKSFPPRTAAKTVRGGAEVRWGGGAGWGGA